MITPDSESRPANQRERLGSVSFRELTAGLAWPLLARSLGQSVSLANLVIGMAFGAMVFGGAWGLDRAWETVVRGWFGWEAWASPFAPLGVIWPTGGAMPLDQRFAAAASEAEATAWFAPLVVVVALMVLAIGLGAIARGTGLALASGRTIGTVEAMRFSLSRWKAMAGGVLVPAGLIAVLIGLIYLVRWVLFSVGFLQPIGATLFVVPLMLGVASAALLTLFLAGHGMLAPAVAVENTDGIDAMQRSWGYILARPIRFVLYVIVVWVILAVAYTLVQWVLRTGIGLSMLALPEELRERLDSEAGYSAGAINFWIQVLWLLFIGWVLSFYGAASTILYLLMRLACDEQDITVIWTPRDGQDRANAPSDPAAVQSDAGIDL